MAYSDLDLNFKVHPLTGDVTKRSDIDAVRASIRSLLLTRKGERPFHNELGSKLFDFLFELPSPQLKSLIDMEIRTAISNFEPRAVVNSVNIDLDSEPGTVRLEINFAMAGTSDTAGLRLLITK